MSNFTQYKVFIAAYEMGSVTAAGQQLNLSASAVSKQILALEERLSIKLFERSNRNITPTEHANQFYPKCKSILNDIVEAEQSLALDKNEVAGVIRLTLSKSLMRSGIVKQLSIFSKIHSKVRFNIHTSEDIQDLQEAKFDFAFRLGKLENSSQIIALPLLQVNPVLCATPSYLNTYGVPHSYDDLKKHRLCQLPFSLLSQSVRDFFKSQKIELSDIHDRANDIDTVMAMTLESMCIGMMLDCNISHELENQDLVEVLPKNRPPSKMLYLVFRKSEYYSNKHRLFKDFIKKAYPG